MSTTFRILGYELRNLARSRWVLGYAGLFLLLTDLLFRFGGTGDRVVLSLTNVVLLLIPLVSLVFGSMHLYHAREFIELMLAQPVGRRALFAGLYGGLALPLAFAFALGAGLPFLWHGGGVASEAVMLLLVAGAALTLVFTALAFLVALRFQDRAMGLGVAILLWLLLTVLYDGAVLLGVALLGAYPLERPLLVAMLLNPVDIGRVLLLIRFDLAALSGYTGFVFERFFGGRTGLAVALLALLAWVAGPLAWGARRFGRKDW
jgi:Cu-processing system permease protein